MFLHFFCTFAPKLFEFFSKILLFMEYNFRDIEKKWQQRWVENQTYRVVEDPEKKNTVIDVTQEGYTLNGNVIRYAKVVVGI